MIVVEDLNVCGMMANHALAGAVADSGWDEFVRQLQYKCEWHGRALVQIGRFFPSSKLCSACGFKNDATGKGSRRGSGNRLVRCA
jgi:putative transposase